MNFSQLTSQRHYFVFQVNYQYRNGTSFPVALRAIYADGGIPRFYRVSGVCRMNNNLQQREMVETHRRFRSVDLS